MCTHGTSPSQQMKGRKYRAMGGIAIPMVCNREFSSILLAGGAFDPLPWRWGLGGDNRARKIMSTPHPPPHPPPHPHPHHPYPHGAGGGWGGALSPFRPVPPSPLPSPRARSAPPGMSSNVELTPQVPNYHRQVTVIQNDLKTLHQNISVDVCWPFMI